MSETAFNATTETVARLLSGAIERVVIPTFQRGYMWQKKHVEAFWEDLIKQKDARQRNASADAHFLGPIVTQLDTQNRCTRILDGQQRIATALITLSVFRDVAFAIHEKAGIDKARSFAERIQSVYIENEEVTSGYSLELGETDAEYFRNTIQRNPREEEETTRPMPAKLRTHRNIRNARKVIYENVISVTKPITVDMDALGAIARLQELKETLLKDFVMARIPVTSQQAAFKIFETLNNRGLRLSPPDLLLSYLMEKASDDDRKTIRQLWTEILQRMGTHDINRFMRHMWVSKYGDLKKEDLFTALQRRIEGEKDKQGKETQPRIKSLDFARLCIEECENYIQLMLVENKHIPDDAVNHVRSLTQELNYQPAIPLLLSSHTCLHPKAFVKVARSLLVFITRSAIVADQNPASIEDLLFALARQVRDSVTAKQGEPDWERQSKQCADDVHQRLAESAPDDDAIRKETEKLVFDNASDAKYMLRRLARYIETKTKEKTVDPKETNLEHIFPQNPKENEWGGKDGQDALEAFLWHIGNLTIYGKRLNREASNKEYKIKREQYRTKSELKMTVSIAEKWEDWNPTTIVERAKGLADDIVAVWNFKKSDYV